MQYGEPAWMSIAEMIKQIVKIVALFADFQRDEVDLSAVNEQLFRSQRTVWKVNGAYHSAAVLFRLIENIGIEAVDAGHERRNSMVGRQKKDLVDDLTHKQLHSLARQS